MHGGYFLETPKESSSTNTRCEFGRCQTFSRHLKCLPSMPSFGDQCQPKGTESSISDGAAPLSAHGATAPCTDFCLGSVRECDNLDDGLASLLPRHHRLAFQLSPPAHSAPYIPNRDLILPRKRSHWCSVRAPDEQDCRLGASHKRSLREVFENSATTDDGSAPLHPRHRRLVLRPLTPQVQLLVLPEPRLDPPPAAVPLVQCRGHAGWALVHLVGVQ